MVRQTKNHRKCFFKRALFLLFFSFSCSVCVCEVLERWFDFTGELEPPDPLARLPQLKCRIKQLLTDLGKVQQMSTLCSVWYTTHTHRSACPELLTPSSGSSHTRLKRFKAMFLFSRRVSTREVTLERKLALLLYNACHYKVWDKRQFTHERMKQEEASL